MKQSGEIQTTSKYGWPGKAVAMVAGLFALCACMDRTTPVPEFPGEILSFEVEGELRPAKINAVARTVEVELTEAVDMRSVRVSGFEVTEGGTCDMTEGDMLDLTEPVTVTVETTSKYEWTISATQVVEYRFAVEGQVGKTLFEMHSRSAFAFVREGTDLTAVNILDLKLSPEGVATEYNPSLETLMSHPQPFLPSSVGGERVREIKVKYRDVTETWSLHVTQSNVMVDRINPFARRVLLTAFGAEDGVNGFEYRPAAGFDPDAADGEAGWIRISDGMMTGNQEGVFTASLTGLEPETEYLVRALSDEDISEYREFTTGATRELPGAGFEDWSWGFDDRKAGDASLSKVESWSPWREGAVWEADRWWDTGNKGVAFVDRAGGGNSLRTEEGYRGNAAMLETRWALVKVAGGNIYFGEFGEMYGLNATCRLGHDWQAKPTGMKGWYKYFPQPVNRVSEEHRALHPYGYTTEQWMGSPDSLHVCVALWASPDGGDIPFEVDTRTNDGGRNFVDFSRDKDGVIAYGAFVSPDEQASWDEFEIEIDYLEEGEMSRTTIDYLNRYNYFTSGTLPPNTQLYLLVTASKNCNYFIAGTGDAGEKGSTMYVDELEMLYE